MTTDTYRVLVTASRDWEDRVAVEHQLRIAAAEASRDGKQPVLVHGQCDPRHPDTGRPIRWKVAKRMSWEVQGRYLGGDWLAEWAALNMGSLWRIERHPADWEAPCRATCPARSHRITGRSGVTTCPAAGPYRNADMVALGADVCLALIKDGSRGASGCADLADKAGILVRRFPARIYLT